MPRKPTKKTLRAKAKRSPTSRRRRIGEARESQTVLARLRRKFEKLLRARTESLTHAIAALQESKDREAARVAELEVLLNTSPIPIWMAPTVVSLPETERRPS
jgi:hypothetical protein